MWTLEHTLEANGLQLKQTTTYTVDRWQGSVVTLSVAVEQVPMSKEFAVSDLPPGTTASLEHFAASGTGTVVLDLTKVTPRQSMTTMNSAMGMVVSAQGQETRTDTKIKAVSTATAK
ncbi:MAG: hypothetical protein EP330_15725 [Deltaproteobacteria bacterium]|nr:MAG: hypothetical protein EP330_15725 [Deltaproteobacteria bacterium]